MVVVLFPSPRGVGVILPKKDNSRVSFLLSWVDDKEINNAQKYIFIFVFSYDFV